MTFRNSFMNYECIKTYIIINKIIVFEIYKRLYIEPYSFFKLKPLRDYNKQLIKQFIIYCLLLTLNVHNYKKDLYFIFIIKIKQYDLILEKL